MDVGVEGDLPWMLEWKETYNGCWSGRRPTMDVGVGGDLPWMLEWKETYHGCWS